MKLAMAQMQMSTDMQQNVAKSVQFIEEAAAKGRKGGVASGVSKRKKKDLRQALEELLDRKYTDKNGNKLTGTEAITAKLFEQAMKGNIKAFETIRSTVGQDPVQKVEQVNIDMEYEQSVEYVKRLMREEET